jgi:hypothetical protein
VPLTEYDGGIDGVVTSSSFISNISDNDNIENESKAPVADDYVTDTKLANSDNNVSLKEKKKKTAKSSTSQIDDIFGLHIDDIIGNDGYSNNDKNDINSNNRAVDDNSMVTDVLPASTIQPVASSAVTMIPTTHVADSNSSVSSSRNATISYASLIKSLDEHNNAQSVPPSPSIAAGVVVDEEKKKKKRRKKSKSVQRQQPLGDHHGSLSDNEVKDGGGSPNNENGDVREEKNTIMKVDWTKFIQTHHERAGVHYRDYCQQVVHMSHMRRCPSTFQCGML